MASQSTGLDANFAVPSEEAAEGYAFIGAVHGLVVAKASATKADLMLAAVCQALREGDKTHPEVHTVVDHIWPGARTDEASIQLGLDLGVELGLVTVLEGLDGTNLWSLTPRGVDDVDRQKDWVKDLRQRARAELIARARDGLGIDVANETAELWLQRLVSALIQGIQASQDAYFGRVDQVVGNRLVPKGIDQRKVLAALDDPRVNEVTVDFLKAAAVAAFDPLDPFGNELVSLITTGCVLHSYVAGRDSAVLLDKLGSPQGQRALIDTPVLVDLVGPARVRERAKFILQTAVKAGWEVVVCEHSLDELIHLLEREIPQVKQSFTEAHSKGIKQEWYASLVDDQLAAYCVEVLQDGTYKSLEAMISAGASLETELEQLGVIVRPHHNEKDVGYVERARDALVRELARTSKYRHTAAIDRDADSIAVVWRRRRRQHGTEWPGGWIVTSDTHITPTYKLLDRNDSVPLALTLARWGTLLSTTVAPAEVVELATAAATQLVEEAMWLLPARYPSDVALALAKQLSPQEGGSELDFRYAQFALDHSLDVGGKPRSANDLASEVLSARAKRTTIISSQGMNDARIRQEEAERVAERASARAAAESAAAASAHDRANKADTKAIALQSQLDWANKRTARLIGATVFTLIGVAALVLAIVLVMPIWVIIPVGVGVAAFGIGGFRWATTPGARLVPVLIAGLIEGAGVVATVVELISVLNAK